MTTTRPRVLLFTGKGGVGKTSVAAATALRCADNGLRTIVLSTDPAHSLADAFDEPLGPLCARVGDHELLWGQQLDAQDRMEDAWADIQQYLLEAPYPGANVHIRTMYRSSGGSSADGVLHRYWS